MGGDKTITHLRGRYPTDLREIRRSRFGVIRQQGKLRWHEMCNIGIRQRGESTKHRFPEVDTSFSLVHIEHSRSLNPKIDN
jgi:hypothetical protein